MVEWHRADQFVLLGVPLGRNALDLADHTLGLRRGVFDFGVQFPACDVIGLYDEFVSPLDVSDIISFLSPTSLAFFWVKIHICYNRNEATVIVLTVVDLEFMAFSWSEGVFILEHRVETIGSEMRVLECRELYVEGVVDVSGTKVVFSR